MTVNAEEAAETQAGAANDGTDILVSDATQLAELAWSHDEPEPEAHRHRWRTAWALAAIFLVCGTVIGGSIWGLPRSHTAPPTAAPSVTATPSPSVAAPPAPPVVTTVTCTAGHGHCVAYSDASTYHGAVQRDAVTRTDSTR